MNSLTFAWICCAVCVAASARTATVFCKARPRLFTVLALFALVWALLLPYYNETMTSELFPAYSGFLLVFIGGLLMLEAAKKDATQTETQTETVNFIQNIGLWLFLMLVPNALNLGLLNEYSITRPEREILFATLLDVVGYISIGFGFWRLCGQMFGGMLATCLFFYSIAEIAHTIISWPESRSTTSGEPMTEYMQVIFGILKLAFTGLFCYAVSLTAMPPDERKPGFLFWLKKFAGFA